MGNNLTTHRTEVKTFTQNKHYRRRCHDVKCTRLHLEDLGFNFQGVNNDELSRHEICERHPSKKYRKWCVTCELPFCSSCLEHRRHDTRNIKPIFNTRRQQSRKIIVNIREKLIPKSCSILETINSDIGNCQGEILGLELNMMLSIMIKAQKLKNEIDMVHHEEICKAISYLISKQREQNEIERHSFAVQKYEHKHEKLAKRPVQFLLFIKQTSVPKKKNISDTFTFYLNEEINSKDVERLLGEIQINEPKRKGVLRIEQLREMVSTAGTKLYITVTCVSECNHISRATSDLFWVSDKQNLILTNQTGCVLHRITDVDSVWGIHTATGTGDLFYIDRYYNINKLYMNNRTKITLISKTEPWDPICVYCSRFNGDLLVGMGKYDKDADRYTEAKVTRYNSQGQQVQTIKHSNTRNDLYAFPMYIAENRNGDVIVSDYYRGVVVTDSRGRHRFSYIGPPSWPRLLPRGICTDASSHILVCDAGIDIVHMIDKDGHILSIPEAHAQQQLIKESRSLSYDDKTEILLIGSYSRNRVYAFRFMKRPDF